MITSDDVNAFKVTLRESFTKLSLFLKTYLLSFFRPLVFVLSSFQTFGVLSAETAYLWPSPEWGSTIPSDVGLRSNILAMLHHEIVSGKFGYIDSLLVIRRGKIAFEKYYTHDYSKIYYSEARAPGPLVVAHPSGPYNYFNSWWHPYYKQSRLHTMQSVTKSVVSLAIGLALKRGEFPDLDTSVFEVLDVSQVDDADDKKHAMTIRDLMTMSAGLQWNEGLPYTDHKNTFTIMAKTRDWVAFTMNQPMSDQPGTRFNYNSGLTLVLAEIFRIATGQDLEQYVVQNLFVPLGISDYEWKRTPRGLPDTQEGLYLSSRDLARIAYLVLRKGRWADAQLIPAMWIEASMQPAFKAVGEHLDYGYMWWLQHYDYKGSSATAYVGMGFGGQRPIILPELDLVIIVTGWNILPDRPFLTAAEAISRVLEAVHS